MRDGAHHGRNSWQTKMDTAKKTFVDSESPAKAARQMLRARAVKSAAPPRRVEDRDARESGQLRFDTEPTARPWAFSLGAATIEYSKRTHVQTRVQTRKCFSLWSLRGGAGATEL